MGGSHRATLALIPHLADKIDIQILLNCRGPLAEYLDSIGVKYDVVSYKYSSTFIDGRFGQILSTIYHAFHARKYLSNTGIHIVHTNDARMHLIWGAAAHFTSTLHFWQQHSLFPISRQSSFIRAWADKVSCVSQYILEQDSFPKRNDEIEVIRNPLTLPFDRDVRAAVMEKSYIPSDPSSQQITLLSISNLRSIKRPDFLFQVISCFAKLANKPVRLIHLGTDKDGYLRKMKRAWVEEGAAVEVISPGFVDDISAESSSADALISVASAEGFGLSLLEGMAMGVPVFACCSGGHLEIIDHEQNGILTNVDSPDVAAQEIFSALNDKELLIRVRRGGIETIEKFSPKECSREMCDR